MKIGCPEVKEISRRIIDEVERAIIGKREVLEKVMAAVLTDGHVLFEDYPGLGKTLIAKSLAAALGLEFKRIQFTPDLLPGDITGGYIFNREKGTFNLRKGPLFANIVLADEINRASPKTQSALLEAMQEYQITIEGETMMLPKPFIVLATQNPIEYEGTFPLPEAQLDRFIMKLSVGYPLVTEEQEILRRRKERKQDEVVINRAATEEELLAMQQAIEEVYTDPDIEKYIVEIVGKTREDKRVSVGRSFLKGYHLFCTFFNTHFKTCRSNKGSGGKSDNPEYQLRNILYKIVDIPKCVYEGHEDIFPDKISESVSRNTYCRQCEYDNNNEHYFFLCIREFTFQPVKSLHPAPHSGEQWQTDSQ